MSECHISSYNEISITQCIRCRLSFKAYSEKQIFRETNLNFDLYYRLYTEGAKSQYPYVGLNSSVTECPIEIILSGMTYYHHWFEEFVKSKHICVRFFQMKVHFRIYLIVCIVGSNQILLDCVWPFELRL